MTNTNLSAFNYYWHLLTPSKVLRILFKRHTIHNISTDKHTTKKPHHTDYQHNKDRSAASNTI